MIKQDSFLSMAHDFAQRVGVPIPPSEAHNPIGVYLCVTRELLKDVIDDLVEDRKVEIRGKSIS